MAKYIPKINDPVFLDGKRDVRYVVIRVDAGKKTALLQTTSGPVTFQKHDVSWSRLVGLDESQNALQIVREATEGK